MCKIKEWIVNNLRKYWPVIIVTVMDIGLLLWYCKSGALNPIGMVTHRLVCIWKDVGMPLAALYVAVDVLIPTISFSSSKSKKEFIDRNFKATIILTGVCLTFSIFATVIKPITCELAGKTAESETRWMILCIFLSVFLVLMLVFFMYTLCDVIRLYKKDIDEQIKAEESKQEN